MTEQGAISPQELKHKLDAGKVEFMLDLRNAEEFKAWRIEGRSDFPVLNIPQEDFVGEEERHRDKFPKDRHIVVVCAHGDSANYTAEILRGFGLQAASLQGGMDAWSELSEKHGVAEDPSLVQVYRTARGCISHVLVSEGEAVVVDAVRNIDQFLKLASELKVKIVHVLDTHLHADHISGGMELAHKAGAVYHLNPADAVSAALKFTTLVDGETITFGKRSITVIHSPGHTPGSTSFLLDKKYLFTGDIIMRAGIGRPDLGGQADAWALQLYDTLFRRYQGLADATVILPSHSSSIREQDSSGVVRLTLGDARKKHDLFQIHNQSAFVTYVAGNLPENPARYQDIRKVNLGLMNPDEAKRKELEIGKNVCGMANKG